MGTRVGYSDVSNTKRDIVQFRTVWKTDDGKAPTDPDEMSGTDSFCLVLGSVDDDTEEVRESNKALEDAGDLKKITPMPTVSVPAWAVAAYRKSVPLFKNYEDANRILVRRGA